MRHVLGPEDLSEMSVASKNDFSRHLTVTVLTYVVRNYTSTSLQMERLVIAQKAFRNAILAVIGGGLALILIRLFWG